MVAVVGVYECLGRVGDVVPSRAAWSSAVAAVAVACVG